MADVLVDVSSAGTCATVSLRYHLTESVFRLPADDLNVRDTFGTSAFLVEEATQQVVRLDAAGRPLVELTAGATYSIVLGASPKLRKQAHELQGKLEAARTALTKLIERHSKFATCVAAELTHLHSLLSATALSAGTSAVTASMAAATAASAAATAAAMDTASEAVVRAPTGNDADDTDSAAADNEDAAPSTAVALIPASMPVSRSVTVHLEPIADGTWPFRPIGHLRTCFVEKNGTPRQGCVCPSSAATLKLQLGKGLNAAHSVEGLGAFSHVWIIFVFHLNGNVGTKSKVHPPRCDGMKTGLFSTRTPHRPNPIGLSLVELEAVRGDTLHFRGIDLVDGTPILDVKPYVPFADGHGLPATKVAVAPWLETMPTPDLEVMFTPEAEAALAALEPSLRLLTSAAQARAALAEVLAADPRSVHWRQQRADVDYGLSLDCLNAVVTFADGVATVTQVQHIDLCDRSHATAGSRCAIDDAS